MTHQRHKNDNKMTIPSDFQVFSAAYEQHFFEDFCLHFVLLLD
jgi:hypothetical protein